MPDDKKKEILEQDKQLDEDEAEAVAGGGVCGCAVAGGGLKDGDEGPCGCAAWGFGTDPKGDDRCFCLFGGGGSSNY